MVPIFQMGSWRSEGLRRLGMCHRELLSARSSCPSTKLYSHRELERMDRTEVFLPHPRETSAHSRVSCYIIYLSVHPGNEQPLPPRLVHDSVLFCGRGLGTHCLHPPCSGALWLLFLGVFCHLTEKQAHPTLGLAEERNVRRSVKK